MRGQLLSVDDLVAVEFVEGEQHLGGVEAGST